MAMTPVLLLVLIWNLKNVWNFVVWINIYGYVKGNLLHDSFFSSIFILTIYRTECGCSESLDLLIKIDDNKCDKNCHGNLNNVCGSINNGIYSIYRKKGWINTRYLNI